MPDIVVKILSKSSQSDVRTNAKRSIYFATYLTGITKLRRLRSTSTKIFYNHTSYLCYGCKYMVRLEIVFLLNARSRNFSCLAPFSTYHLMRDGVKTIWLLRFFAFADGRNCSRATCAASECTIRDVIAFWQYLNLDRSVNGRNSFSVLWSPDLAC